MKYELTVLCPAFREETWYHMYMCIKHSFSGSWQLVLVTEKPLPKELVGMDNIKVIYSERSPMHKQQQGLVECDGKYITVVSDDSIFHTGTLDKTFEIVRTLDYKTIVVMKYLEGSDEIYGDDGFATTYDLMRSDKYYRLDYHARAKLPGIPPLSPLMSCVIISKQLLEEVGGWDCCFETQALGNVDLSARLIKYGAKYVIAPDIVSSCGWNIADNGDHGPVHTAHVTHDQPLLEEMYSKPTNRMIIPINNWEKTPNIWWRKNK